MGWNRMRNDDADVDVDTEGYDEIDAEIDDALNGDDEADDLDYPFDNEEE